MNAHRIRSHVFAFAISVTILALFFSPAEGSVITEADIVSMPEPAHVVHSGNGQLDLILFTFDNGIGVNNNELKERGNVIFNGDDANTDMPVGTGNNQGQGNNKETWASESYITSIGELRDFYRTTFSDGQGGSTINEIALFVDLCETGQGHGDNTNDYIMLNTLDIIVGYDAFPGEDIRNDPWNNDIGSDVQNSTGSGFSGGTTIACLDAAVTPRMLPVTAHGSGWADCLIFTGIDPFDTAFDDETPILFFWESTNHEGGGTDVFLSGVSAPEPATIVTLALGGLGMLLRRRRK
ncbi:MAG: PEP-CTERM sorting domain-containing protein [Planctomycetota bacterium]|nr:PEP-CTERM sorting domain-containing protein [Planctomycetota bacterium]